ncbi:MAG: hypothetical protein IZT59_10285 [Verrucomicrobia bacterium]|nr:hypothetical protein [Verrucomicrobiota bacterium]
MRDKRVGGNGATVTRSGLTAHQINPINPISRIKNITQRDRSLAMPSSQRKAAGMHRRADNFIKNAVN